MPEISDLYEALSFFSEPIKVHPTLNVLDGGKTNGMNEVVPFTAADLAHDSDVEELNDPVVPKTSNVTLAMSMAQSLDGGGNTLPRSYAWYSEHDYREGTLVECFGHVLQVEQKNPYHRHFGVYVYYLKGDDTLEPTIQADV